MARNARSPSLLVLLSLAMLAGGAAKADDLKPGRAAPSGARGEVVGLRPPVNPYCIGEYSDFLSDLLPANAAFEKSPDGTYSYCLRTIATYEHLFYGRGGKLKRTYLRAQSHGTGFAYKMKDGDYYLATNEHVAEYPEVTDEDHQVEGVPVGSRKVREVVKIVASDTDDYEPGQIVLTKVLADPGLDIAILKTKHLLKMMPYRIGTSAALRPGNAVVARGFPLGVFPASNSGKVTNPYQEDSEPPWEHTDFVTDALLNPGSSGSPVFAVSCRTGELELVGLYHAHYTASTGLGLVIGIDQLRDVLENLRLPRTDVAASLATGAEDRRRGRVALEMSSVPLFFPYAERTVRAQRLSDGAVEFSLFRDFPISDVVQMGIVDRGGHLFLDLPSKFSLPVAFSDLDPALRDPLEHLTDSIWHSFRVVMDYRQTEARGVKPDGAKHLAELKVALRSREAEQKDLLSTVDFESEDISWLVQPGPVSEPGADAGVVAAASPAPSDGGPPRL